MIRSAIVCLLAWSFNGVLRAQDAVLPDRPDKNTETVNSSTAELGKAFTSVAAGISFRSPPDCKEIRRTVGDEVVQYVDDKRKWNLRVTREVLSQSLPLVAKTDENNVTQPGRVEILVGQMMQATPSTEIVQQDVSNIGDNPVGRIRSTAKSATSSSFRQQAIIQANEKLYYVFDFISPAPAKKEDITTDPDIVQAVRVFDAILDSVKLIDQEKLINEQNDRLFRTRTLYVNITEQKIKAAIVPQTLLRFQQDGKDVGYSVIYEEIATDLPRKARGKAPGRNDEGLLVGIRSFTVPEAGVKVTAETWQWTSLLKRSDFGWKRENWISVVSRQDAKGLIKIGEVGVTDSQTVRRKDPRLERGEVIKPGVKDENQPAVREYEEYTLNVTQGVYNGAQKTDNTVDKPLVRGLPPFYMPQSIGQLLPRLLPRNETKGYMFAFYRSESREVMRRFMDVGIEQPVSLGGQKFRAIPITDRLGYEGSPTIHYISPDGKYLGSYNAESKTAVIATDEATLRSIWGKDLNIDRPGDVTD